MRSIIKENVQKIIAGLPRGVTLVGAAKMRDSDEVRQAIEGGLAVVGENYVQEAEIKFSVIGRETKWHLLGHLQKNKVKKAVKIFDMIQTVDSIELAALIDRECEKIGRVMPVLIEVNSSGEPQKTGISPDEAMSFIDKMLKLPHLSVEGLMTMGPWSQDRARTGEAFANTRELYETIGSQCKSLVRWRYLSMGMSSSYKLAIEEGANMVRIGTLIFGERPSR